MTQGQEAELIHAWRERQDQQAINRLIHNHRNLLHKLSRNYSGYGLPEEDLIAEGYVGMMHAIKHYDPTKGFKFSTYAVWWIKAFMHEFVLTMHSMVRLPKSPKLKKLFFKFNQTWERIDRTGKLYLSDEVAAKIATELETTPAEIKRLYEHLHRDLSLNNPIRQDHEGGEWQDFIIDEEVEMENQMLERHEYEHRRRILDQCMEHLTPRERTIFTARRLTEPPKSLSALSGEIGLSSERIRQIEHSTYKKVYRMIRLMID